MTYVRVSPTIDQIFNDIITSIIFTLLIDLCRYSWKYKNSHLEYKVFIKTSNVSQIQPPPPSQSTLPYLFQNHFFQSPNLIYININ